MNYSYLWLLFFILSLLSEVIASPGLFYFLAFSIGSLGAALAAFFNLSLLSQVIVFLGISTLSFFLLKVSLKHISRDTLHKTNIYALQGKKGLVTEMISGCAKGWVKIEGEQWAAVSVDESIIEKGAMIEVVGSAGSHLKVKKIKGHC